MHTLLVHKGVALTAERSKMNMDTGSCHCGAPSLTQKPTEFAVDCQLFQRGRPSLSGDRFNKMIEHVNTRLICMRGGGQRTCASMEFSYVPGLSKSWLTKRCPLPSAHVIWRTGSAMELTHF